MTNTSTTNPEKTRRTTWTNAALMALLLWGGTFVIVPASVQASDPCEAVPDKSREACQQLSEMGAVGCQDADDDGDSDLGDCTTMVCDMLNLCNPGVQCEESPTAGSNVDACMALVCGFLGDCDVGVDCGDTDQDGDADASDCYALFCGTLNECLCPGAGGDCSAHICSMLDVNAAGRGGDAAGGRGGCDVPCASKGDDCVNVRDLTEVLCTLPDSDGDEDCAPDVDCGDDPACSPGDLACAAVDVDGSGDCAPWVQSEPLFAIACLVADADGNGDCAPIDPTGLMVPDLVPDELPEAGKTVAKIWSCTEQCRGDWWCSWCVPDSSVIKSAHDCSEGYWVFMDTMGAWNDRVRSAVGLGGCNLLILFEHAKRLGSRVECHSYCPDMNGMEDEISSLEGHAGEEPA